MANILLIDDNEEILSANKDYLINEKYDVTCAETGIKAIACLNEKKYDCIVLDILLPDLDGFAICKAARSITNAPIIFLSCMDDVDDKVKGLMAGGDDYMTKPYSMKELAARIHALLRRGKNDIAPLNGTGAGFSIDHHNKMIQTPEKNIFLSQKEFDLFLLFYENPEKLFSKEYLSKKMCPLGGDIKTVAVYILKLRRKLDSVKQFIGTIDSNYGAGYRLIPPQKG